MKSQKFIGGKALKTWRCTHLISALLGMAVSLSLSIAGVAQAVPISTVVPNSLAAAEGNSNFGAVFNLRGFEGFSSQRYQQVYAASEFSSLPGPSFITQIAFRPDATFGSAFSSTIPNIQINFSTTSSVPDGLGFFFANNVGADDTVVYSGSLALSSVFTGPVGGPKEFDILINLSNSFLYDWTEGNLLLDIRLFSGSPTTQFDAQFVTGDSISRLANFAIGSSVNDPSGDPGTNGFVTRFTMIPAVPEPSSLALFASGLAGLAAWRRKQKRA